MTYTYVTMGVSQAVFNEVRRRLLDAGYTHAVEDGTLDMHGIALVVQEEVMVPEGFKRVFFLQYGTEPPSVVINRMAPAANDEISFTVVNGGWQGHLRRNGEVHAYGRGGHSLIDAQARIVFADLQDGVADHYGDALNLVAESPELLHPATLDDVPKRETRRGNGYDDEISF